VAGKGVNMFDQNLEDLLKWRKAYQAKLLENKQLINALEKKNELIEDLMSKIEKLTTKKTTRKKKDSSKEEASNKEK